MPLCCTEWAEGKQHLPTPAGLLTWAPVGQNSQSRLTAYRGDKTFGTRICACLLSHAYFNRPSLKIGHESQKAWSPCPCFIIAGWHANRFADLKRLRFRGPMWVRTMWVRMFRFIGCWCFGGSSCLTPRPLRSLLRYKHGSVDPRKAPVALRPRRFPSRERRHPHYVSRGKTIPLPPQGLTLHPPPLITRITRPSIPVDLQRPRSP